MLHDRVGGAKHDLTVTLDSSTTAALGAMVGGSIEGKWILGIKDREAQDSGTLNRWTLEIEVASASQARRGEAAPAAKIPDNDPTGVSSAIALTGPGTVQQLKVGINISHTFVGDLRVELLSPTGRRAILHPRLGGAEHDLVMTYDSSTPSSALATLVGQTIAGNWILRVSDLAGRDVGMLDKWSIEAVAA